MIMLQKKLNENLDFFYELASSISAPYLFRTKVLRSCNDLLLYNTMRNSCVTMSDSRIAHELEDVYSQTRQKKYNSFNYEYKEIFTSLIKSMDEEFISDVINNASHKLTCDIDHIEESIELIINKIDESTNTKEPKIVLFPPEMAMNKKGLRKLTDNLKVQDEKFSDFIYTTFVSRLIPENKILVAAKSNDKFDGYVFCPYMLMCHYEEKNNIMIRVAKKLLRNGGSFYGLLTIDN